MSSVFFCFPQNKYISTRKFTSTKGVHRATSRHGSSGAIGSGSADLDFWVFSIMLISLIQILLIIGSSSVPSEFDSDPIVINV